MERTHNNFMNANTSTSSLNSPQNMSETLNNLSCSISFILTEGTANSTVTSSTVGINVQNQVKNQPQPETNVFYQSRVFTVGLHSGVPFKMDLADVTVPGGNTWKMRVYLTPVKPDCSVADSGIGSNQELNSEISCSNRVTKKNPQPVQTNTCLSQKPGSSADDHIFAMPQPVVVAADNNTKRHKAPTALAMDLNVYLTDWWIQYNYESGHFFLFGNDKCSNRTPWKSRPLETSYIRLNSRKLKPLNSCQYILLVGKMKDFVINGSVQIVPKYIQRLFLHGFPVDWKVQLNNMLIKDDSSEASCSPVPLTDDPAIGHGASAMLSDNGSDVSETKSYTDNSTTSSPFSNKHSMVVIPAMEKIQETRPPIEKEAVEDNWGNQEDDDCYSESSILCSVRSNVTVFSEHSTQSGSVYSNVAPNPKPALQISGPMIITNWVPIIKQIKTIHGRPCWQLHIKGNISTTKGTVTLNDAEVGPLTYRKFDGLLCINKKKYALKGSLEDRGLSIPTQIRNHFIENIPVCWSRLVGTWGAMMANDKDRVAQLNEASEHSSDVTLTPEKQSPVCSKSISSFKGSTAPSTTKPYSPRGTMKDMNTEKAFVIESKHCRALVNWMPELVRHEEKWGIILTGKLVGPATKTETNHRSSVIIYCISLKKIETDDMIYILKGPMASQTRKQTADFRTCIPNKILKHFYQGIPSTWQKIIPIWVKTCNIRLDREEEMSIQPGKSAASNGTKQKQRDLQQTSPQVLCSISSRGRQLKQTQPYWLLSSSFIQEETSKFEKQRNKSNTIAGCPQIPPRSKSNPAKMPTETELAQSVVQQKSVKQKGSPVKSNTQTELAHSKVQQKAPRSRSNPAKKSTETELAQSNVQQKSVKRKHSPAKNNTEMELAHSKVQQKMPRSRSNPAKKSTETELAQSNVQQKPLKEKSNPAKNNTQMELAHSKVAQKKISKFNPSDNTTEKQLPQPMPILSTKNTTMDLQTTKIKPAVTITSMAALKERASKEDCKVLKMKALGTLSNLAGKKLSLKKLKQQEDALIELTCLKPAPDPFEDPDNMDVLGEEVDDGYIIVTDGLSNLPLNRTPSRSFQCTPIANYIGCLASNKAPARTPTTTPTSGELFSYRPRDEILRYNEERKKEMNKKQIRVKERSSVKPVKNKLRINVKNLQKELSKAVRVENESSDSDFSLLSDTELTSESN